MAERVAPREVDEVAITILVDNTFDVLMAGKGPVERWPLPADVFRRELPIAPAPALADLAQEGIEVVESTRPSFLVGGSVLVSGEVPRTSSFETGFALHWAQREGAWASDPQILDDQCAIFLVRGKGLVVLTGCSHAGIVNTVRQAVSLTGVDRVHAVVGGFHLTGAYFEPRIPETVEALKAFAPDLLVPGHCTGFDAQRALADAMPQAFVPSGVGTTVRLVAPP